MQYKELDTPSLVIDRPQVLRNLANMQDYANRQGVALRPHTKTHKMPHIAKLQRDLGAKGITVAKVGEAKIMAQHGLDDIFIANEVVGRQKLEAIADLAETIEISFGVDCPTHILAAQEVFANRKKPAQVVIEIEVGEARSGIIEQADFLTLLDTIETCPSVHLKGIFSHEGHCYNSVSMEACHAEFLASQKRTLDFAHLAQNRGFELSVISIGSTPSLLQDYDIDPEITEIRPGTYVLMDASMGATVQTLDTCAATILTTVISKPTSERVITDVGAKGLTAQRRTVGISATPGCGTLKDTPEVHIDDVFDEHAIIYHKQFHDSIEIGDKVEIIPVHICPACNLYDTAYFVENGEVVEEVPILCRGQLR